MLDNQVKQFLADVLNSAVADGGPGSGNYGHKGRPGLQGGSGEGGATETTSFKGMRNALQTVKTKLKGVSGGTFDKDGNSVSHDSGFQVTFYRPHVGKLDESIHDGLVQWMCEKYNTTPEFGVWTGDDGVTDAELSFRVEKQEDAEQLMKMFNQDAIMSWEEKSKHPDDMSFWFKDIGSMGITDRREPDYERIYKEISGSSK